MFSINWRACGLLIALLGPISVQAETQIVASILPTSRSVQLGESASLFATIINAGPETAENCRIESDPSTLLNFQYGTTNPITNAIEGSLDTPVSIAPGASQTFFFSVGADQPRASFEFKPQFVCNNAPVVPTIAGVNSINLSVSELPVADVIALSETVSADGITTLPQRASATAFAVATSNLGAGGLVTVSASLSDPALPASIGLCETDPQTGVCVSPSQPISGTLGVQMAQGETSTFGFFVSSGDDIAFDPAANRVFVRFTDNTGEIRGATSVALRSRVRAPDEPLQLIRSIAARGLQLPLRSFDRLLGLHREVVAGVILIASEGTLEVTSRCERRGSATFTLQDIDSTRTLSENDLINVDFAGCDLGFGTVESGKVQLRITNLQPALGIEWTLGGRVEIVEPIVSAPEQLPFTLNGSYEFSVNRGVTQTSDALASLAGQPISLINGDEQSQLSDFAIAKTTLLDTGGVNLSVSGRLDSASLGGSVLCDSEPVITPGTFSDPVSGELVCEGLGGSKVKLSIADAIDARSDILIDVNNTGTFDVVAADVNWFELSGNRLFEPGTNSALLTPRSVPLAASAQVNLALSALAYSSSSDELVVANQAGLIILDPATLAVIDTAPVPGNVTTMVMSMDGRTLFVGYDDRSEIQPFDVPDRTLQTAISLGTDSQGEALVASDIALDPTNSQRIAVALYRLGRLSDHAGVALFEAGVKLSEMTPETAPANRILFTPEGRLFGLNTLTSEYGLRELFQNGQGLSAGLALTGFFDGSRRGLLETNGLLASFGRAPTFVDFDARRVVGQLTADFNFTDKGLVIDSTTQQAYYVGRTIDTYELQNFTRLGSARTNLLDDIQDMALTPDYLLVAEASRLSAFPREQLAGGTEVNCVLSKRGVISYFDCPMNDSVYHADTDQFLVSVGSGAGANGNSIAFVDPGTATIERYTAVGSEPGDIDLSSDNLSLFVALRGSNSVAELVLATDQVQMTDALLDGLSGTATRFAQFISASPDNPQNFIAALNERRNPSTFRLISGGASVVSDRSTSMFGMASLVFSATDSTRAVASGLDLAFLTLDASGVIDQVNQAGLIGGYFASDGKVLIDRGGRRLDLTTLIADSRFAPIASETVGYDPQSNRVLFLQQREVMTVHDGDTGELLSSFFVPGTDTTFSTPPNLTVTPSGAFLAGGEHGGWFIPAALYVAP